MGSKYRNNILQSIINSTNIFGIGKKLSSFKINLNLETNEYTIAEFLSGVKIMIGDIFQGGKILSIKSDNTDNGIKIFINPIIYDNLTNKNILSSEIKILNYKRTDFASLHAKRY